MPVSSTARPQPTSGGDLEPVAQKQSRRVVNHVYLLESSTTRRTYVGFSTEPLRRLKQHNGLAKGGAAPAGGRPWRLLLFVSGFNSKTSALAFEWAWHFPTKSRLARRAWRATGRAARSRTRSAPLQLEVLAVLLQLAHWGGEPLELNVIEESAVCRTAPGRERWATLLARVREHV